MSLKSQRDNKFLVTVLKFISKPFLKNPKNGFLFRFEAKTVVRTPLQPTSVGVSIESLIVFFSLKSRLTSGDK